MKRTLAFVSALGILFFLSQPGYAGKPERTDPVDRTTVHYGNHNGEVCQLEVSVSFYGQYGETVTDENGTFYNVFGYTFFEPKIYPPQYWGVFPLYFFDAPTGIRVSVIINISAATLGATVGAGGFGVPIVSGLRSFDPILILRGSVPVALLAMVADTAFRALERSRLDQPRHLRQAGATFQRRRTTCKLDRID